MTNGRQKGNAAEREVATYIRGWWDAVEPGCEFVRTPSSGGWQTPSVRAGFAMSGDLCTTAKRWPFSVEVKRREAWDEKRLVLGRTSPVWGWWRQCQTAAKEMNSEPMMWFRRSRKPWLVMLPFALAYETNCRTSPWCRWSTNALGAVDYGDAFPIVYAALDLLRVDPRAFAK